MAIEAFFIKEDDLQPYYRVKIQNYDGSVVDLSGATVRCTVKLQSGVIKVNRQLATVTTASTGEVEYQWASGDTNTPGDYYIEFEISPSAGGKFTLPSSEKAEVFVVPSLDTI